MSKKFCVMSIDDVPEEHRNDYLTGLHDTALWARHEQEDAIADQSELALHLIQDSATSRRTFWEAHGALASCANALQECPHCFTKNGPCDAAGMVIA